jgi:hypothetical protein
LNISEKRKSLPREEVRQASRKIEQRLGGGVPLFCQAPLGRRSGSPEHEDLREEVHCFVDLKISEAASTASA